MEFNLPTTKDEMYRILNDLFYYYRIRRAEYEEVDLRELELERLVYTPETDEEIAEKAEKIIAAEKAREKAEYIEKLNSEITKINTKIELVQENYEKEQLMVVENCEKSKSEIYDKASDNGLYNSSAVSYRATKLEDNKSATLYKLYTETNKTLADLASEQQALEQKLSNVDAYFEQIHAYDTEKKIVELKDERSAKIMEVFKYNNGLDEKEQRYLNTMKQTKASLKLRYMDISTGEFTKDQLVEMGYYEDVIRCVCGYFDRLDPYTAFQDISSEKKLAVYLDDYYQNIIYTYNLLSR